MIGGRIIEFQTAKAIAVTRPLLLLAALQTSSLTIGIAAAWWYSHELIAPLQSLAASCLLVVSAVIVGTHPDGGIALAILASVAGFVFGFPFLLPSNDSPLLLVMMMAVCATSLVFTGYTRTMLQKPIWGSRALPQGTLLGRVLIVEVAISTAFTIAFVILVTELDALSRPLAWPLAVVLPAIAWFMLPAAREGMYLRSSETACEDCTEPTTGPPLKPGITKTMVLAGCSIAVLFVIGMFLPIFFAYFESLRPYYAIGGTFYIAALSMRALTLRSVR
ncbi:MAG: hypothetical protein ACUVT7_08915 [Thermoplasmata archaeon]